MEGNTHFLTILNNYRMSTYIKNQTGGILDSTNICWMCPCVWSGELSRAVSPATHYGSFNWKVSSVPFYQHSFIRLMAFIISEIFCLQISQLSPCLQPPDCKILFCRLRVIFEKNFLCIQLSRSDYYHQRQITMCQFDSRKCLFSGGTLFPQSLCWRLKLPRVPRYPYHLFVLPSFSKTTCLNSFCWVSFFGSVMCWLFGYQALYAFHSLKLWVFA